MSITKISFAANKNTFNKIGVSSSNTSTTTQTTETQTQTEQNKTETNTNTKNHKVRNWSIGLGAAATLIGLGVLGRSGKLGKGMQKLLGGAEKEAGKDKLDELADEIMISDEELEKIVDKVYEEIQKTEKLKSPKQYAEEIIEKTTNREANNT